MSLLKNHGSGSGGDIVIEYRDESEVSFVFGKRTVPEGVKVLNPAFDVTPAQNITAIVTEMGVFEPGELRKNICCEARK